jgi:hypothetical protein
MDIVVRDLDAGAPSMQPDGMTPSPIRDRAVPPVVASVSPEAPATADTRTTGAALPTTGQSVRAGMLASFAAIIAQAAAAGDIVAVQVAHDAIARLLAAPGLE